MSKLSEIAESLRKIQLAKNEYQEHKEYDATHPNALSDGDEKGKGDVAGSFGSAKDIAERSKQIARNQYGKNKPYDQSSI